MADHVRTQCRDAVVALLTGLSTTGANVFAGRPETRPLQTSELPGVLVYTNDTQSEPSSGTRGARRFEHVCDLVTESYAAGTGDIDKVLDTIEKEIRTALEGDPTLSGKAKDLYCAAAAKQSAADAEQPTWQLTLTWRLEYHTREASPDAALA